jgi:hypothetical protein
LDKFATTILKRVGVSSTSARLHGKHIFVPEFGKVMRHAFMKDLFCADEVVSMET